MRTALAALALVAAAGGAQAQTIVSARHLLEDPKGYRGQAIAVRRIRCVDPGRDGFVCETETDGRRLRLNASGLGGGTTDANAEKLIGPCKGVAALSRSTCTFDVSFLPTGSGFEDGVTIINTPEIDMSVPRRR